MLLDADGNQPWSTYVRLYNYALSPKEISAVDLASSFKITAVNREGNDLRLTWDCIPGRSYVVQTNAPGPWRRAQRCLRGPDPAHTRPSRFFRDHYELPAPGRNHQRHGPFLSSKASALRSLR